MFTSCQPFTINICHKTIRFIAKNTSYLLSILWISLVLVMKDILTALVIKKQRVYTIGRGYLLESIHCNYFEKQRVHEIPLKKVRGYNAYTIASFKKPSGFPNLHHHLNQLIGDKFCLINPHIYLKPLKISLTKINMSFVETLRVCFDATLICYFR